jgi:hypothetical protein
VAETTMAETTMDEMVLWTKRPVPSTTEYYFSLQSGGVSGEDVGGELYRRPLRSPEVRHLSVGPYQGRLQGIVQ